MSADFEDLARRRREELHRLASEGEWDELARVARQGVVHEGAVLLGFALEAAAMLRSAGQHEDAIAVLAEASRIQQWDDHPDAIVAWLGAVAQSLRGAGDDVLAQ